MKTPIPTESELLKSYEALQFHSSHIDLHRLTQMTLWSRLDARLCEMVVQYIAENFEILPAIVLRKKYFNSDSQPVLCVLVELAEIYLESKGDLTRDWKLWKQTLQSGVAPAPFQSFFVNIHSLKPEKFRQQAAKNLSPFSRWGFYADRLPISDKLLSKNRTRVSPDLRQEVLRELLQDGFGITINDYLKSLNFSIHRRQAERDLKKFPGIQITGFTRNRKYSLK